MSWEQLEAIQKENREIAREERTEPITQCPECFFTPLKVNKDGFKYCPICGWTGK